MSELSRHDYRLAYGMTFTVNPGPHEFVKVQRSDDLCRVCAKGELHEDHLPSPRHRERGARR